MVGAASGRTSGVREETLHRHGVIYHMQVTPAYMGRSSQPHATTTSTALRHRAQRYATRSHLAQALARTWPPIQGRRAWLAAATRHMLVAAPSRCGRQCISKTWSPRNYYNETSRMSTACPLANTYTTALSRRSAPRQPPLSAATRACAPLRGASDADRHTRVFDRWGFGEG